MQVEPTHSRFHVQRLAHDALDEVRRDQMRNLVGTEEGKAIKKTCWVLHKNPWKLTGLEHDKVAQVQRANRPLYRAYLLKESLAGILGRHQLHVARTKLHEWIDWAARSRLPAFQKLAKTIRRHLEGILGHIATGLSNGPVEGLNGKIRPITRCAYGFHNAANLIAFIFLCCTGLLLRPVFKTPVSHPLEC